ncbi:DNA cytosine methyltransferase [Blautia sp. AM23-13AC]|nr:DNA cytosine methyltransferase [Blautia sp. AM23-13AC]
MTVVDLFCGCGGMSLGFQEAGFNILAGFEHWNTAISCYKKNFSHPVEDVDLSNVDLSVKTIAKYTPDIIIGGPPCQDFSGAGNRIEGDRADLTIAYANIIQKVSPQYFVMENVERAASSNAYKKARKIFKDAGYGLTEKVLDASFCGVPQKRKRFFCIGYKNGPDSFLDGLLSTNQSVFPLTVREYFTQENYNLSTEYYYRHPRSYKRRGIFSVDEPSPTIRGVNRPKPNNYKKHSGDLVSPDGVRNLTALERSLIQTFPPNFVWDDSSASTEQMIGNAVPVKLAHYVATCLMRFINGDTDLHNLRFIDWLKKEKTLSAEVAGDTLSRIGRARRILDFEDNDCETYLKKLNEENLFKGIVPSVRAQIRRAVRLYFEYVSNHTEVES